MPLRGMRLLAPKFPGFHGTVILCCFANFLLSCSKNVLQVCFALMRKQSAAVFNPSDSSLLHSPSYTPFAVPLEDPQNATASKLNLPRDYYSQGIALSACYFGLFLAGLCDADNRFIRVAGTPHRALALAMLVSAACTLGTGISFGLIWLFICRLLLGFAEHLAASCIAHIVTALECTPVNTGSFDSDDNGSGTDSTLSPASSSLTKVFVASNAGLIATLWAGGSNFQIFSTKLVFYLLGFLQFIWLFPWLYMHDATINKHEDETRHANDANSVLKSSRSNLSSDDLDERSSDTVAIAIPSPPPLTSSSPSSSSTLPNHVVFAWRRLIRMPPIWAVLFAHCACSWAYTIISTWFPTYMLHFPAARTPILRYLSLAYILQFISARWLVAPVIHYLLVLSSWRVTRDNTSNGVELNDSLLSIRRRAVLLALVVPSIGFFMLIGVLQTPWVALLIICMCMTFLAFNTAGSMANHADLFGLSGGNTAASSFALANTLGELTAALGCVAAGWLLMEGEGRWFPVHLLTAVLCLFSASFYWHYGRTSLFGMYK